MPVIGIQIREIAAKKNKNAAPGVKINSTPQITNVEEKDFDLVDKKVLLVDYVFTTTYEPDTASVKIAGDLLFLPEDSKKIVAEWKKSKTLPKEVLTEIMNALFRKCLAKVLYISEDMQLPPPLPIPVLTPQENKSETGSNYIG